MILSLLLCGATPLTPVAQDAPARPAATTDVLLYSTRGDERVHLVSAADLTPIAAIEVEAGAHELAISADGRFAIGSAYGGPGPGHQPPDHRVFVVDLPGRKLHRMVDLGELQRPNDIGFLPGSHAAMVTVEVPPHLVRLDAAAGTFVAQPIERKAGHMLALSPDGRTVYVSHVVPGSLSVVDAASGETKASIPLPAGAEGIGCAPDGKRVWVASNRAGSIAIVDVEAMQIVQTLPCPGFPLRLKVSPDGHTVAASCTMAGEIAFFDADDPGKTTRVPILDPVTEEPLKPTSIAFTPDGRALAAVASGARPQVVRIDLARKEISHRLAAAGPIADALCAGTIPAAEPADRR
jgi:DNA-binding beta-propeller fold protein YncE